MRPRQRRSAATHSRAIAGYGLVAVLVLVLTAPLLALLTLSFWTQTGFTIDTTPTLANYWSVIEPSDKPTVYFGIPFHLANPVPAILFEPQPSNVVNEQTKVWEEIKALKL